MSKRRPKGARSLPAAAELAEQTFDLLAVVDRLTLPRKVATWQRGVRVEQTHAPLLDVLREAVSAGGVGLGAGRPAHERAPISPRALELEQAIVRRVRDWLVRLDPTAALHSEPTLLLRRWYVALQAKPWAPAVANDYRRVLDGWATEIEHVADPPRRIELGGSEAVPCPVCGATFVLNGSELLSGDVDENDAAISRALAVFERSSIEESYAVCAVCLTRWEGRFALQELGGAIDDASRTAAADDGSTPSSIHTPEEGSR